MGFTIQSLSYLVLANWCIALAVGLLVFRRAINPRLLGPALWGLVTTAALWTYLLEVGLSWRIGPGLVLWAGGGWLALFSQMAGHRRWFWAPAVSLAGGALVVIPPSLPGEPVTVALVVLMGVVLGILGRNSWARGIPWVAGAWIAAVLYFPLAHRGIEVATEDFLGVMGLAFVLAAVRRPFEGGVRPELSREALRWGDAWLKQGPVGMVRGEVAGFVGLSRIHGAKKADLQVLHAIHALGRSARPQDRALWLGGGQFLWIVPGIGYEQDRTIKERIRAVFSSFPELGADLRLGWAWGQSGARVEDVMAEAERALDEVKARPWVEPRF